MLPDNVGCYRGAEGENRTRTLSLEPDFESGASTNSATSACCPHGWPHGARSIRQSRGILQQLQRREVGWDATARRQVPSSVRWDLHLRRCVPPYGTSPRSRWDSHL